MGVTSCAMHPDPDKREMFVCTRYNGLYHCKNVDDTDSAGMLKADQVDASEYPFRAPTRVFYLLDDPDDLDGPYQVWVTSNGNGLRSLANVGADEAHAAIHIDLGGGRWARISGLRLRDPESASATNPEDVDAIVDQIMTEAVSDLSDDARGRLRAALSEAVRSKLGSSPHWSPRGDGRA